jgi:D-glycero-D-manno-heptose 1,7-bisphosphate phosphatase
MTERGNTGGPLKTVFVDRDGVINRDSPDYIKTCGEFHFLPGSVEALKLLSRRGYTVIVVTNQSVIGRGLTSPEELQRIFEKMKHGVKAAGGRIDDIMYCPHTPSDGCACRKPKPGMILEAAAKHSVDLETAVMIGDSTKDIRCGISAGVGKTVLVRTGNGEKALAELESAGIVPDHVADDLMGAASWIMERENIHG